MTQREIIMKTLEESGDWIPSFKLQKENTPYGWLGSSADRTCRKMAEDKLIERKQEGKYAYYRAIKPTGYRVLKLADGTIVSREPIYKS